MIAISFILAAIIGAVICVMMARANVENPMEYQNPLDSHFNLTDAATPSADIVLIADRLRASYLVQDVAARPGEIELAQDASLSVRGINIMDQEYLPTKPDPTLAYTKLTYLEWGKGRLYFEAVIAKNRPYVAGTNGFAREYVAGVDDPLAVLGRTKCAGTTTGDLVDVTIDTFRNGGV